MARRYKQPLLSCWWDLRGWAERWRCSRPACWETPCVSHGETRILSASEFVPLRERQSQLQKSMKHVLAVTTSRHACWNTTGYGLRNCHSHSAFVFNIQSSVVYKVHIKYRKPLLGRDSLGCCNSDPLSVHSSPGFPMQRAEPRQTAFLALPSHQAQLQSCPPRASVVRKHILCSFLLPATYNQGSVRGARTPA